CAGCAVCADATRVLGMSPAFTLGFATDGNAAADANAGDDPLPAAAIGFDGNTVGDVALAEAGRVGGASTNGCDAPGDFDDDDDADDDGDDVDDGGGFDGDGGYGFDCDSFTAADADAHGAACFSAGFSTGFSTGGPLVSTVSAG